MNYFKIASLSLDDFTKNVMIIASSTFFIYGIMYLGIPILSKLYGPDEYGKYTLTFAFVMISSILASAKYDIALLIPEKFEDAIVITQLGMLISIIFSSVVLIILTFLNYINFNFLYKFNYLFDFYTAFLIAIYISLITLNTLLLNWISRKKDFKGLSLGRFIRFFLSLSISIGLGFIYKSFVCLLIGDIIGLLISSVYFYNKCFKPNEFSWKGSYEELKTIAIRFKQFPMFSLPSSFVNKLIVQSPIFLLNHFFTTTHVGNYGMCERLLSTPTSLISEASSNVFRGELSSSTSAEHKKEVFFKVLKRLTALSVPIFIFLYLFGGIIIEKMFGPNWELAVVYSKYLIFPLLLQFIFTPLTFILFYFEKQKLEFGIQIFSFLLLGTSIFIYSRFFTTDTALIITLVTNTIIRISLEYFFSHKIISQI